MYNKKIALGVIFLGFVIILGIIYLMFFYDFTRTNIARENASRNKEQQQEEEGSTSMLEESEPGESQRDANVKIETEKENLESPAQKGDASREDLQKMASSFVERFGSYSNHSNYGNITSLQTLMTDEMAERVQEFVKEKKSEEYSGTYQGVTTNALTSEVNSFDSSSGNASIVVTTKRRESTDSESNVNTYTQKITVNFVKEDGMWKVDEAEWEE